MAITLPFCELSRAEPPKPDSDEIAWFALRKLTRGTEKSLPVDNSQMLGLLPTHGKPLSNVRFQAVRWRAATLHYKDGVVELSGHVIALVDQWTAAVARNWPSLPSMH
jgi:hypothetical protein